MVPDPSNPKSGNWWLTHIMAPLFVVLIGGILYADFNDIGYFEPKPELSYKIQPPLKIVDEDTIQEASIKIDDVPVTQLYAQPVCVWSSGQKSIKDLDISYTFNKEQLDKDFRIMNVIHNASPASLLRHITKVGETNNSKEYEYGTLNEGDGFRALFMTNRLYSIKVDSGTPDLRENPVTGTDPCDCVY